MNIWFILALITAGLISGFLAGLFGIGGGVILVPAFWLLFPFLGIPESEVVKLSIGTSLSIITITTLFTSGSHLLKGNINIKELIWLMLWVIGGVTTGIYLSHILSSNLLKKLFALLLIAASIKHFFKKERKTESKFSESWIIPATVFLSALLSSLLGIGGGVIVNSFLFSFTSREVAKIVALSSSISFLNALLGSVGYILVKPELQVPYQIGYVYLPAVVLVSLGALIGSKAGLLVLYRTKNNKLKMWFSLLLVIVALKILLS